MKAKFATSESEYSEGHKSSNESNTSTKSPFIRYLEQKNNPASFRKTSAADSDNDRTNFCFNLTQSQFTVMRSYLNANQKQTELYYTKFTPSRSKLSQICIVHGYAECSDDYLRMAQLFAKRGNVVHLLDLRGFGYSGGSRVNEPIHNVLHDIEMLLTYCCERDLPTFIVAQGLGSLFVESLLQQNSNIPIAGFISISPLLTFREFNNTSTLQKILHKISPFIFGNMLVHNMINPTAVCKDPLAIKAKIDSVFFESFITLNMAYQYEQVCQKVRSEAYKFTYPVFLCYGLKDYITSPKTIQSHYHKFNSTDKQTYVFPDGYHDLHKDIEAQEMFGKIAKWIEFRRKLKSCQKWKPVGVLNKGNFLRWNNFWKNCGMKIAYLLLIAVLFKILSVLKRKLPLILKRILLTRMSI